MEYFNGKIDEILIFDTALSQTEVEQIHSSFSSEVNNPIVYWNFNEGSESTVSNLISDNYHGTVLSLIHISEPTRP